MGFYKKKDFSHLTDEEIYTEALESIFRYVSISEQSSNKLLSKLKQKGYPDHIAEQALQRAIEIGAVDDRRYSECLVRYTAMSGKGLKLAENEISKLGIDINSLEAYQEYCMRGEEAIIDDAIRFLESRTPRSKNLQGACYKKLLSRGFSTSIASSAARLFCENLKENNPISNDA